MSQMKKRHLNNRKMNQLVHGEQILSQTQKRMMNLRQELETPM